jgi:hypothetical protein
LLTLSLPKPGTRIVIYRTRPDRNTYTVTYKAFVKVIAIAKNGTPLGPYLVREDEWDRAARSASYWTRVKVYHCHPRTVERDAINLTEDTVKQWECPDVTTHGSCFHRYLTLVPAQVTESMLEQAWRTIANAPPNLAYTRKLNALQKQQTQLDDAKRRLLTEQKTLITENVTALLAILAVTPQPHPKRGASS